MAKKGRKRMRQVMTVAEVDAKIALCEEQLRELQQEAEEIAENVAFFKRLRTQAQKHDGASWSGLRFHQALRRIVAESGRPMTTAEIVATVNEKGIPTKSKDIPNLVYVTMKKRKQADGYTFAGGKWGLKEWKQIT